jgi:thiol-disulfide isomerase/thioredoxin
VASTFGLGRGFDLAEAEAKRREALEIRLALQDQDPTDIAMARKRLADVLVRRGKFGEASSLNADVITHFHERYPDSTVVPAISQRATILELQGSFEEAAELRVSLLENARRDPDPMSRSDREQYAIRDLARVYVSQGRLAEAAELYQTEIPVTTDSLGIRSWLLERFDVKPEQPTLLVFWEEWCPWCQLFIPELDDARERGGSVVQVIGLTTLSWGRQKEEAIDFVRRNDLGFPHAVYDDEAISSSVGWIWYPMVIALNEGRVVWRGSAADVTVGFMRGLGQHRLRGLRD